MATQLSPRQLRLNLLLDQQLWFLGHDIRHAEGNALVRFGFERERSTDGGGTTCYRLALRDEPGEELLCWGFALYCGRATARAADAERATTSATRLASPAGVLLMRQAASARLVWPMMRLPLHKPSELPRLDMPQTEWEHRQLRAGVVRLARQLARYEAWAERTLGIAHRTHVMDTLPRHKRRRFAKVTGLGEQWCEVEARYVAP
jgi:hypothetical protein